MTKKKTKTKKQQSKKSFSFSIEMLGVFFLFISVLAGFRLGFIGLFVANLFRFFVGSLDRLPILLLGLYGLTLVIKGKDFLIGRKYVFSSFFFFFGTLVLFHFYGYAQSPLTGKGIVLETLHLFKQDLLANQIESSLYGGMLGAVLYASFVYLFSKFGMLVFVTLGYLFGVFLLFDISLKDVVDAIQKVVQKIQIKDMKKLTLPKTSSVMELTKQHMNRITHSVEAIFEDEQEDEGDEHLLRTEEVDQKIPSTPTTTQNVVDSPPLISTPVAKRTSVLDEIEDDTEDDDILPFKLDVESEDDDYQLPPLHLLQHIAPVDQSKEKAIVLKNKKVLEQTFKSFGVDVTVMDEPLLGPAVTKYEIKPAVGVKVSKIVSLSDDLALALAAKDIRIEAPIPGKPYVGIEVPNTQTSMVAFSDVVQASLRSSKPLEVPLGRDISGEVKLCDLTKMPHMLIAGSTGSGKSVCINGIITSILMKTKPNQVKMMMIDPKRVELNVYNGIPHLLTPVVTNPRKAAQALQKVVAEMEKRYELFASFGIRNIDGYNALVEQHSLEMGEEAKPLPYIVVIVDELADLMMVASNEVEEAIIRLAQMARAAGIHMVLATQRPSVDVITGIIKANVPSRIAFAVSSGTDSRTIIDTNGAEKLLGRGDMLFVPMGENKPIRVQGAFLSDEEVERVVDFVKTQQEADYDENMMPTDQPTHVSEEPEDDLFANVVEMLQDQETVSTSFLQRKYRIGYNRAARLIDALEERGLIGPSDGSKPRRVLIQEMMIPNEEVKLIENMDNEM